jgi:hypothetical protein
MYHKRGHVSRTYEIDVILDNMKYHSKYTFLFLLGLASKLNSLSTIESMISPYTSYCRKRETVFSSHCIKEGLMGAIAFSSTLLRYH